MKITENRIILSNGTELKAYDDLQLEKVGLIGLCKYCFFENNVIINKKFNIQLKNIINYTTYFWGYKQAEKLISAIFKQIDTLEKNPNLYIKIDNKNNWRFFSLKDYPFKVVFKINEVKKTVKVLKIVHTARNKKFNL